LGRGICDSTGQGQSEAHEVVDVEQELPQPGINIGPWCYALGDAGS
jgi:hypothetical protein